MARANSLQIARVIKYNFSIPFAKGRSLLSSIVRSNLRLRFRMRDHFERSTKNSSTVFQELMCLFACAYESDNRYNTGFAEGPSARHVVRIVVRSLRSFIVHRRNGRAGWHVVNDDPGPVLWPSYFFPFHSPCSTSSIADAGDSGFARRINPLSYDFSYSKSRPIRVLGVFLPLCLSVPIDRIYNVHVQNRELNITLYQ